MLFFLSMSWLSCEESSTPQKEIDKDKVESELKKSTSFERDTIRKDGLRIEKKTKKSVEK